MVSHIKIMAISIISLVKICSSFEERRIFIFFFSFFTIEHVFIQTIVFYYLEFVAVKASPSNLIQ